MAHIQHQLGQAQMGAAAAHPHHAAPASPSGPSRGTSAGPSSSKDSKGPQDKGPQDPKDPAVKNLRMGTAPIGRLLLEFAPPTILACACTGLYNLINTIFLGQALGSAGIAATTVGYPLQTLMFAFAMWFGAGGNARAAIKMGEGKPQEAERCLGNTILLNIVVDGILTVIMLLTLDPLLYLCGADADSIQLSRDYMGVMVVGFVIQAIGPSLNNFIRTDGSPTYALFTMIVGCSVSIFCNWLFVLALGMGAFGAGLGTVMGQLGACIAVLSYFRTKRSLMKLRLANLRPDRRIISDIVGLGLSSFILQIAAAIVSTLLNNQCVALGASDPIGSAGALAVIGSINKVVQMCGFVIFGISIAVQPIIGFNYGARIYQRVRRALWVSVGISTVLAVVIWVLVHLTSRQILGVFGLEESLHDFGAQALSLFMLCYFLQPIQVIGSVFFQSTHQPLKATFLSLTRQVIILLPALYLVPAILPTLVPSISPLLALTCAQPTSDLISALIVLGFQVVENRRLAGLIEGQRAGTVPPPLELVLPSSGAQTGTQAEAQAETRARADGSSAGASSSGSPAACDVPASEREG